MKITFGDNPIKAPLVTGEGWKYAGGEEVTIGSRKCLLYLIPTQVPQIYLADLNSGKTFYKETFIEQFLMGSVSRQVALNKNLLPYAIRFAERLSKEDQNAVQKYCDNGLQKARKKFGPKPEIIQLNDKFEEMTK